MPARFTPTELLTLHNSKFFYVKAAVTNKVDVLLAHARDEIKTEIGKHKLSFPKEVDTSMGKIFRGENYLGLPYLVLDYPRHFSKRSVFAFRSMFWWGKFYSCTLHLQGEELNRQRKNLVKNIGALKKKNIFICVNRSPWHYHYEKDNYLPVDKLPAGSLLKMLEEKEFIKLSRKISLGDYKKLSAFCRESFLALSSCLDLKE